MYYTLSVFPWESSVIFGNLRQSLEIFGKYWKTMVWPSDNFFLGKCSETFRKSSKKSSLVCLYNKQINTWLLVDMRFLFSCLTRYLTPSLRSLVRHQVEHYALVVVLTVAVLVEVKRKNYWITNSSISVKVLKDLFRTYLTRDPFSKWRTSFWYCCHNFV